MSPIDENGNEIDEFDGGENCGADYQGDDDDIPEWSKEWAVEARKKREEKKKQMPTPGKYQAILQNIELEKPRDGSDKRVLFFHYEIVGKSVEAGKKIVRKYFIDPAQIEGIERFETDLRKLGFRGDLPLIFTVATREQLANCNVEINITMNKNDDEDQTAWLNKKLPGIPGSTAGADALDKEYDTSVADQI